jgi:exonuclease III
MKARRSWVDVIQTLREHKCQPRLLYPAKLSITIDGDILKLTEVMDQMDLIDIYRTFHPKTKEYTFFSALHGTFSKTDHIIGHKTGLNKYKKTEVITCIL